MNSKYFLTKQHKKKWYSVCINQELDIWFTLQREVDEINGKYTKEKNEKVIQNSVILKIVILNENYYYTLFNDS